MLKVNGQAGSATIATDRAATKAPLPRVLYLSFFFPPSRASGVFRGRATANHLAQAGWDVTVVTAPRDFFGYYLDGASDESLEATVDSRVNVVRPKMITYHWERDVRRFGVFRGTFPTLSDKLYRRVQNWIFPEYYLGWAPGVIRKSLALHRERHFDLVIATGNPFVSFALARWLGRRLKIPYVVDYRDSWTYNQFTDELLFPEDGKVMRWESRIVRDAAEIVFVNDVMRQWAADRYPFAVDRMTVVRNGWDPDVLGQVPHAPADPDRPLRFGYLGTVTGALPLDVLFEGWRRARGHPLLAGAELNVYGHLGFFPHSAGPLRSRLQREQDAGVRYHGAFSKTEAAKIYGQTDALVFCPGGTRYVTSAKIFEYMATGKPIASVHAPGIAAEEVLRGYPLWSAAARLDADHAAEALIAAARAAREAGPAEHEAAQRHAERFTRDAALAPWEARLRAMVEVAR
ncbi:glycosyltransferase [Micromonospora sp. CPCC 206061]|uniref:glycosyltransferase n=1 Tax=Micromonospora sp. CPCC 206061 TaxID=3122410 RepID=UPI002FF1A5BE